jgi:hypothetical protein
MIYLAATNYMTLIEQLILGSSGDHAHHEEQHSQYIYTVFGTKPYNLILYARKSSVFYLFSLSEPIGMNFVTRIVVPGRTKDSFCPGNDPLRG